MKKIFHITTVVLCAAIATSAGATSKRKGLQSQTSKGVYIATDVITKAKLKDMPVPNTGEDYALYQSIENTTSIVLGDFKSGKNTITLISDGNSDGEVDTMFVWFCDTGKYHSVAKPETVVTKENFLQMKKDIVNGTRGNISPNPEGVNFIRRLVKDQANKLVSIAKSKQGYVILLKDPDETTKNRITFSFSDNGINGTDISFNVAYRNVGEFQITPVISFGVFCRASHDPFAKEVVEELGKMVSENKDN